MCCGYFLRRRVRSDVGFGQSADGSTDVGVIDIACTKTLGNMTGHKAAKSISKVRFEITDPVTDFLFRRWVSTFEDQMGLDTAFFFPYQGPHGFDFRRSMTQAQHDQAIRKCASDLHLASSQDHLRTFTSQSVRVGVSTEVAAMIRDSLTKVNKAHGRSRNSLMDVSTYVPDQVLMAPGPLFGNDVEIQQKYETYQAAYFGPLKQQLLCRSCGYPACECPRCQQIDPSAATQPRSRASRCAHTCWIQERLGRKRLSGPSEDQSQKQARQAAWTSYGIDALPVWCGEQGFNFA
jgi:hypothetical protein